VSVEQLIEGQLGEFDLIIILDTNSYSQLAKFDRYLKQTDKPVLVIDHHVTGDGLGSLELVETDAAATALIVYDLLKYADWPINERVARALFVGIATDTGWFHFRNTDSRVHRTCAALIDIGLNPTQIYHDLYQNLSPARFKLMVAMLSTVELHFDDRYATQYLLRQDFDRTGATYADTEDLINECQRIGSVDTAALFVELKDGRIKCSLRSKGAVDVCKIAQKFGGGGHKSAAGTYLPGPLESAKQLIYDQVAEQLSKTMR
jgi:phosphoesterase RecJ-like protein